MTSTPGILLWILIVGEVAWLAWLGRHWYQQLSDVRDANRMSGAGPGRDETLSG